MPLLDHFHSPLATRRHWEGFHAFWASAIAGQLNTHLLPPGYFAEPQVSVGTRIEVDVASFGSNGNGHTATSHGEPANGSQIWLPAAETLTMPAIFPDEVEVLVYQMEGGATLVGAIELISPGNKDRPDARRAFAAKCASYLQAGIGLIIVDIVTSRHANLHDELVRLLEQADMYCFPTKSLLYAVVYHPMQSEAGEGQIEMWPVPLAVGKTLPTLPLGLRRGPVVLIDLELTYTEARQRSRL